MAVKQQVVAEFQSAPAGMRALPQWTNWREEIRNGKPTKAPYSPVRGGRASSTDPATWGTFEQAVARFDQETRFKGVGFVFSPEDPYTGIDLDNCLNADGTLKEWAVPWVSLFGSYTEITPSGNGLHMIIVGRLLDGKGHSKLYEDGKIEVYDRGRYFTVTGNRWPGSAAEPVERQEDLTLFVSCIFGPRVEDGPVGEQPPREPVDLDDRELLGRMFAAKNGAACERLWRGDTSDHGDDDSAADLALCNHLAFWTDRDAVRMDTLFRQSGLYRDKWERAGYRNATIARAIAATPEGYSPPVVDPPRMEADFSKPGTNGKHPPGEGKPQILVMNREDGDMLDDMVQALENANEPPRVFVRTGELTRWRHDENQTPLIERLDVPSLRLELTRAATFFTLKQGKKGEPPKRELVTSPEHLVRQVLKQGSWLFPALAGVVEAPVLRPDGTIMMTPGYDPATRLIFAPTSDLILPPIPDRPTRKDVEEAVALLMEEMLGDFPFEDPFSKANMLALEMTPFIRPGIKGSIPLALIDAPSQGSGKGLLCSTVALIATGRPAEMRPLPHDEEELRKSLTSIFRNGETMVIYDNVTRVIDAPLLALALTAPVWKDRWLHLNDAPGLPVACTWMANGNNLRVDGDIPRRCYQIRINAKESRPWRRSGLKNLHEWIPENRGRLIAAILTICRAWFAEGKPYADVPVMGSFEGWAVTTGRILAHAGVKGFLGNLDTMHEQIESTSREWEVFLLMWRETYLFDQSKTMSELVDDLLSGMPRMEGSGTAWNPAYTNLFKAIPSDVRFDVTQSSRSLATRLGIAFGQKRDVRHGEEGLHLHCEIPKGHNPTKQWSVLSSAEAR